MFGAVSESSWHVLLPSLVDSSTKAGWLAYQFVSRGFRV